MTPETKQEATGAEKQAAQQLLVEGEPRAAGVDTKLDHLLRRADSLAAKIGEHQQMLAHILQGGPAETKKRLRILFHLVGEARVGRDDLLGSSGATLSELLLMAQLGLIRPSRGGFALTARAESLLGILLFFDAEVMGALSKGFGDLLQAALHGDLDASTMAQILAAGARRLSEQLGDQTRTESLRVLDQARPEREKALDHVTRMLGRLRGKIDSDAEGELRAAANTLNASYMHQEATHLRTWRQDVRYAQGHTHADLVLRLSTHSLPSLLQAMDNADLRGPGFAKAIQQPSLVEVRRIFQREHAPPVDPATLEVVAPTAGTQRMRPSWAQLLKELEKARDGAALHEATSGPTTYFAATSAALIPNHPLRRRFADLELRVHEDRIHEGAFLDVPRITIHKRKPK